MIKNGMYRKKGMEKGNILPLTFKTKGLFHAGVKRKYMKQIYENEMEITDF